MQEIRCKTCGAMLCKQHEGQLQIGNNRNMVTVTPQGGTASATCKNGHKNNITIRDKR